MKLLSTLVALAVALTGAAQATSEPPNKGRLWIRKADDARITRSISFLYPQTKGWTVFANLSDAMPGDVDDGESLSHAALAPKSPVPESQGNLAGFFKEDAWGCSIPLRLFSGHKAHEKFRREGVWLGQSPAIIYSGSTMCSEASMTLIWNVYGEYNEIKSVAFSYGELISIKTSTNKDEGVSFTTYYNEGGGSSTENYTIIDRASAYQANIEVNGGLIIPQDVSEVRRDVILKEERILQAEPGNLDKAEYMEGVGSDAGYLAPIPAGTKVQQRLLYKDPSGQEWRLVVVPTDHPSPDGNAIKKSVAGWIKVLPR